MAIDYLMYALIAFYGACIIFGIINRKRHRKRIKSFGKTEDIPIHTDTINALESDIDEIEDINLQERIAIAEETIIRYNRLLDTLTELYKTEADLKKRSIILSKQVATMEKLNRALEKREKLG